MQGTLVLDANNVTNDSFLYAIFQAYEARYKGVNKFNSHLRFESFLPTSDGQMPQQKFGKLDLNAFKKGISAIVKHHFSVLPNYRKNDVVTLDNLAWFSLSIATLLADLEYFVLLLTGAGLPKVNSTDIVQQNTSSTVELALEKYFSSKNDSNDSESLQTSKFTLFPLLDKDQKDQSELYANELWSLIFVEIKKEFASYADLIFAYVNWNYTVKTVESTKVDWSVRPPCGSLYRKEFKELFEERRWDSKSKGKSNHKKNGSEKFNSKEKLNSKENASDNSSSESLGDESADTARTAVVNHANSEEGDSSSQHPFKSGHSGSFNGHRRSDSRHNSGGGNGGPNGRYGGGGGYSSNGNNKGHSNGGPYNNGAGKGRNKFDQQRNFNNDRGADNTAALENALEEVNKALQKLESHPDIREIFLKPQNSFVRRQQHMEIIEKGYTTESVGEDEQRCVCIKQKN